MLSKHPDFSAVRLGDGILRMVFVAMADFQHHTFDI